jgi:hypothetical protein
VPSAVHPLLAAGTEQQIPGHASQRRSAAAAEIALFRRLAAKWLADYGLNVQLIKRGTLGPVISTVLRTGASRALIGRFDVASSTAIHHLFAVAEATGKTYSLTATDLSVQRDLEDGKAKCLRSTLISSTLMKTVWMNSSQKQPFTNRGATPSGASSPAASNGAPSTRAAAEGVDAYDAMLIAS